MQIRWMLVILCGMLWVAGCARFPSTPDTSVTPEHTVYSEIHVVGVIDPNYHYFFAFDTDQNTATGPVPVVGDIGLTNGWGTISGLPQNQVRDPDFYVEYYNGTFSQHRRNRQTGVLENLGSPFRYGKSGNQLWVEVDASLLDPLLIGINDPIVQVNWITMNEISTPIDSGYGKEYDGFGSSGNDYLDNVPVLGGSQEWRSGVGTVSVEPVWPTERTTSLDSIDISDWIVQVRTNR